MAFSPTQFSARTPLNTVKVLLIQRNISVFPTERIRRIWISSLSACLKMIEKLRLVNVARFSVSMAGFSPYTASETKSPIPLADILHENLPHFALISP
jgi:hypothetical protein